MDIFLTSGNFTPGEIIKLNYCRLYLNVHTVADISLADGITLDATMQKGQVSLLSSRAKQTPIKQSRPPELNHVPQNEYGCFGVRTADY